MYGRRKSSSKQMKREKEREIKKEEEMVVAPGSCFDDLLSTHLVLSCLYLYLSACLSLSPRPTPPPPLISFFFVVPLLGPSRSASSDL